MSTRGRERNRRSTAAPARNDIAHRRWAAPPLARTPVKLESGARAVWQRTAFSHRRPRPRFRAHRRRSVPVCQTVRAGRFRRCVPARCACPSIRVVRSGLATLSGAGKVRDWPLMMSAITSKCCNGFCNINASTTAVDQPCAVRTNWAAQYFDATSKDRRTGRTCGRPIHHGQLPRQCASISRPRCETAGMYVEFAMRGCSSMAERKLPKL